MARNIKKANKVFTDKTAKSLLRGTDGEDLIIPDGFEIIDCMALSECIYLSNVTIPDSVTTLRNSAFSGCDELQTVIFGKDSRLATIGDFAFYKCMALTAIEIPAGVKDVCFSAFSQCTCLRNIEIPSNVTSIEEEAFYGCTNLKTVTFGTNSHLTAIGDYAFCDCWSLTSVTIPAGVTSIGNYAFNGCTSLTSVTIPESVTTIGTSAFERCVNLKSVIFETNSCLPCIGALAFRGCSDLTRIEIPTSAILADPNAFSECSAEIVRKVEKNLSKKKTSLSERVTAARETSDLTVVDERSTSKDENYR